MLSQGVDLSGYRRVIIASHAAHALNEHGRGTSKWIAGDRLSHADFLMLKRIVGEARSVHIYTRKTELRIRYQALVGGRAYTFVETVSAKQKRVGFKTMWRRRESSRGSEV